MAGFSGLSFSSNSNSNILVGSKTKSVEKATNISEIVLLEPENTTKFGIFIFKYLEGSKRKDLIVDDEKPENTLNITRSNKTLLKQGKIIFELINNKSTKKLFFMMYLMNKQENLGYILVEVPKEDSHTKSIKNIKKYEYMLVTYRIAPTLLCDFLNKIFLKNKFFDFIKTLKKNPDIEIIDGENKIDKSMDINQCRTMMKFDTPNMLSIMTLKNFENFKYMSYYLMDAENKQTENIKLYTVDILLNLRGKKENTIDVASFTVYNYDTNNSNELTRVSFDEMSILSGNLNVMVHMKEEIIHNMIIFIPSISYQNRRRFVSHGLDDLLLMFLKKIATPKHGNSTLRLATNNRKMSLFNIVLPESFDLAEIIGEINKKKASAIKSKNEIKKPRSLKKASVYRSSKKASVSRSSKKASVSRSSKKAPDTQLVILEKPKSKPKKKKQTKTKKKKKGKK